MDDPHHLAPGGRVIMISGASRGIGLAIADKLQAEGYRLSLGVRSPEKAAGVVPGNGSEQVLLHRFEATDRSTAQAWVEATIARFGRLDGLINNAGIWRALDFSESGDEDILDEVWEVNVKGPFRLIRCCLPHLRASGHGRIINIASTDAKRYRDSGSSVAYAMSKHAVMALTHAARFAGWDDGVRATALCPGGVDTEFLAGIPNAVGPGSRLAPETIATAVSFLLGLSNTASVAELVVNTRLEPTL